MQDKVFVWDSVEYVMNVESICLGKKINISKLIRSSIHLWGTLFFFRNVTLFEPLLSCERATQNESQFQFH